MSLKASFGCDGFSNFVFDDLDSFDEYCPDVLSLSHDLPDVFLRLDRVMGGRPQRNNAILIISCQGYMLSL